MYALLLLALFLVPDDAMDALRAAIEKTAGKSYFYSVQGRFLRTGVFQPPNVLSSRIENFRGASKGALQLLKGPDGLWQEPDGMAGEKIEGLDPDIAAIMTSLRTAEEPHRQVTDLIPLLGKGREDASRKVEGVPCRIFLFSFNKAKLQEQIDVQMKKGITRGILDKPALVRWSTLRGTVRVYIHAETGFLVRVIDKRSVKIFYRTTGIEEVKRYINEMDYRFSGQGGAKLNLPEKVLEKLGLK